MSKSVLIAIAGGVASALLAGFHGVPSALFLAILAPLPLLIVGLGSGAGPVALAGGSGVVVASVLGGGLAAAGAYGGAHAIPSLLVVRQSLLRRTAADGTVEWSSAGSVVSLLAVVIAAVTCGTATSMAPDIENSLRELVSEALIAMYSAEYESQVLSWAAAAAPVLVGLSGAVWVTIVVVNGVLAQRLLARGGNNVRPTPRWSGLTLPNWLSWLLVGTAAVGLAADGDVAYLARNAILVLAVPYFFLGLAVVHGLCRSRSVPTIVLVAFYVVTVWLLKFVGPVVAGVGVLEQWVGVRRRFGAPDRETE